MTTQQRLNRLEDEFSTVKELLISAARHASSANERLEQLTVKVDRLTESQETTQTQLDRLTESQETTQTQLNQLSERVDAFVFNAQRLFSQTGERMIIVEGQTERLVGVVQMLQRNYSAQQSQLQEFQLTTNAALERIDRILDYLLKQKESGEG
ncbi:MAG: 6-aminohexanoate hydrolase [Symploca sp. SIO2G7]|nr:6-aminohexanoate hydrolase [Symploca sp. SIO2G7]